MHETRAMAQAHGQGDESTLINVRALQREARVAGALREVAGALGASLELDELLELVLRKLTELVEAERAVLFLLDEAKRELVSRVGGDNDFPIRLPLGEGVLSRVARSGRAVRRDDFQELAEEVEWDVLLSTRTRSAIATPLKNNLSRTIGVLLVINKRKTGSVRPENSDKAGPRAGAHIAFDEQDEEILSILAKQAAVAIDNSRLLVTLIRKNQQLQQAQEQLTRRVRDLELLFELERATGHALSHEELARAVLSSLGRACNAGGALLILADESHEEFVDYCLTRPPRSPGQVEPEPRFWSHLASVGEGILASVIASGLPIQIDAADAPLKHPGLPEVVSVIGEPLEGEGQRPLGALALINKRGGPFTAEDLGLLRLVCANVSTAVRLFNTNVAREREERLTSIGRLMSQVVHDLKSPLTVISGYVQLMEESASQKERQAFAREILKQFQALGAMQREVLAFARGETEVFARKVIVDRMLADVAEQMRAELDEKKVTLKLSTAPRLVAQLDSERIVRALQNLIRNAAEAMQPLGGGTVTVRADGVDDTLTLRVSDTGPGIPPKIAPRLFQSFVTAGKVHGTGLGLAIVKRIVEEHGGSVALCTVTRGACFLIELPGALLSSGNKAQSVAPARMAEKASRATPSSENSHISEVTAPSTRSSAQVAHAKGTRARATPAKKKATASKQSASKQSATKQSATKQVTAKRAGTKPASAKNAAVKKAAVKKNVSQRPAAKAGTRASAKPSRTKTQRSGR